MRVDRREFSGPAFTKRRNFGGDGIDPVPHRYVKTDAGVFHYPIDNPNNPTLVAPARVDGIDFDEMESAGEATVRLVEYDHELYGEKTPPEYFPAATVKGPYIIDINQTTLAQTQDVEEVIVEVVDSYLLSSVDCREGSVQALSDGNGDAGGLLVGSADKPDEHLERVFVVERTSPNAPKQRVLLSEETLRQLYEDDAILRLSAV